MFLLLNNFITDFMNNIIKIKKQVKAYIKKEELEKISFFIISFDNTSTEKSNNTFKITKNQYLQSEASSLVGKKNLKFPLEIKQFQKEDEIQKYINNDKKNSISLIKINNNLFLGRKVLSSYLTNFSKIYSKFNNIMLNMVRLLRLLKYLNENREKQ